MEAALPVVDAPLSDPLSCLHSVQASGVHSSSAAVGSQNKEAYPSQNSHETVTVNSSIPAAQLTIIYFSMKNMLYWCNIQYLVWFVPETIKNVKKRTYKSQHSSPANL